MYDACFGILGVALQGHMWIGQSSGMTHGKSCGEGAS